jgi:hypothetical protein
LLNVLLSWWTANIVSSTNGSSSASFFLVIGCFPRPYFASDRALDAIFSIVIYRGPVICSGWSRGRRKSKRDDKLMQEAGVGTRVILTRCGTVRCLCPTHYALGSVSGAKPSKNTHRLSITREGEGVGAMVSGSLVSFRSQTEEPFQFPYKMVASLFSISKPCCLSISSVTFQFLSPIAFLFPSSPWWSRCAWCYCYQMILSRISSSTPSRPSLSFFSWSFVIISVAPFGASATPMRYYCMCHCVTFVRCAGIAMPGRALSSTSMRPVIRRPYALRGWRGRWGGGIPIRV